MIDQLLCRLADGEFHSGQELGAALGISRTAVWKRLKQIEALGISLESVKGRGYRIPGGLDLLCGDAVQRALDGSVRELITELELLTVTDSTNLLAMEKAVAGAAGYVCAAEQQTAGRGRRGRNWVSPFGANIYLSVVWEFAAGAAALEGLSLAVGVAIVDALTRAGVPGVQLKWPNDVLANDKKLAGVLLEMVGDAAGPCRVVVGVGVNVAMPAAASAGIDQSWTDLRTLMPGNISRNELLGGLLNEILPLLAVFEQRGFSHYRERWQALDAFAGQEVFMHLGDTVEVGTAAGVDASGAIIVNTASGRRRYSGGEISLRRAG